MTRRTSMQRTIDSRHARGAHPLLLGTLLLAGAGCGGGGISDGWRVDCGPDVEEVCFNKYMDGGAHKEALQQACSIWCEIDGKPDCDPAQFPGEIIEIDEKKQECFITDSHARPVQSLGDEVITTNRYFVCNGPIHLEYGDDAPDETLETINYFETCVEAGESLDDAHDRCIAACNAYAAQVQSDYVYFNQEEDCNTLQFPQTVEANNGCEVPDYEPPYPHPYSPLHMLSEGSLSIVATYGQPGAGGTIHTLTGTLVYDNSQCDPATGDCAFDIHMLHMRANRIAGTTLDAAGAPIAYAFDDVRVDLIRSAAGVQGSTGAIDLPADTLEVHVTASRAAVGDWKIGPVEDIRFLEAPLTGTRHSSTGVVELQTTTDLLGGTLVLQMQTAASLPQ